MKRGFYMNVKIGKSIKMLRNRYNVTQERLAEAICVTSQAISKWENEMGYPDIEYITPIANFSMLPLTNSLSMIRLKPKTK